MQNKNKYDINLQTIPFPKISRLFNFLQQDFNNVNKTLTRVAARNAITEEILFDGLLKDNVGLSHNFLDLSWTACCSWFYDNPEFCFIKDITYNWKIIFDH